MSVPAFIRSKRNSFPDYNIEHSRIRTTSSKTEDYTPANGNLARGQGRCQHLRQMLGMSWCQMLNLMPATCPRCDQDGSLRLLFNFLHQGRSDFQGQIVF